MCAGSVPEPRFPVRLNMILGQHRTQEMDLPLFLSPKKGVQQVGLQGALLTKAKL